MHIGMKVKTLPFGRLLIIELEERGYMLESQFYRIMTENFISKRSRSGSSPSAEHCGRFY